MTQKITLYTMPMSQNAVRPELALLEKGVPFEKVQVDLMGGEHKQPPYGEITPRRQVPTLVYGEGDEAITLYESVAIIQFLDDMHPEPPLMPPVSEPALRAKAWMRIAEFQQKLDSKNIFGSVTFGNQTREQLGARVDALLEELLRWDAYVGDGPFLCGDQFTLADIAVFPLLMHFEALGYAYAKRTSSLHAYMNNARPVLRWCNRAGWRPFSPSLVNAGRPGCWRASCNSPGGGATPLSARRSPVNPL
jgi:glutathione S-transferase